MSVAVKYRTSATATGGRDGLTNFLLPERA
jgi:hypothetical protein